MNKIKYIFMVCLFNMVWAVDISGIYKVEFEGKETYVEIFKKNNKFYAVGFANKDGVSSDKDLKNPNPALRDRDVRGSVFVWNLTKKSAGEYAGGRIYSFSNGGEYHASAKFDGNILKLKASKDSMGFFGKTFEWHKLSDTEIEPLQSRRIDVNTLTLP
ncbi:DUF2147 domain-containing protein [Helicobacter didelphidarum]|uniref:DUF2147 domain-containing protein n=1 Tax=Helicobacter didelphidarum TaxID=2040648 RepID=A0A3D8ILI7_9HELI|nr:DUF2147 domain-containing protein [Helicobacter didelphidarum]RDU66207.1 DUF2147 domain-containing protein [Helicobacter didelphidarum]